MLRYATASRWQRFRMWLQLKVTGSRPLYTEEAAWVTRFFEQNPQLFHVSAVAPDDYLFLANE